MWAFDRLHRQFPKYWQWNGVLWTQTCCWAGGIQVQLIGTKFNDAWIFPNFTLFAMEINLRHTTSKHILHMHRSCSLSSSLPSPHCRPVQYIHHSFINSENSSLVNCLGKFNFKRKLLKEKDIIKLQGFLCPHLVQGGRGDMCCELCSSAPHCSMSGKSYTHV